MDIHAVKSLVEDEVARCESFTNFHGITPANLRSLLVEPFIVRTDPDDEETQPRDMWVVLQERHDPAEGYVVVYDPTRGDWGIAERGDGDNYVLVVSAQSMAEAINSM